jgi:hypothetical protein
MKFKEFNLNFASFIISGCILDMAMGSFFQLHLIYFFYLFIFINVLGKIKPDLTALNKNIPYTLSALVFFLISFINYYEVVKLPIIKGEIFNIIWWSLFVIYMDAHISTINDFNFLLKRIFFLAFVFSLITSLCGAYKFFCILNGNNLESFYTDEGFLIFGTSLTADYNIFAMGIILGVLSGKYLFEITRNKLWKIFILLSQFFMLGTVLFSNSRRGFIFIIISILVIIFYHDTKINLKNTILKNLFFISLIVIFIFGFGLFDKFFDSLINNTNTEEIFVRLNTLKTEESVNDRIDRLELGMYLLNNYSISELFTGKGFFYLELFSTKFKSDIGSDHPHNFLLSTMLYGGFFAFCIISYLTFRVSRAYIKNMQYFKILPFWFLIILIIAFTSTNSFFSIKLMIILSLIPFMSFNYKHYCR